MMSKLERIVLIGVALLALEVTVGIFSVVYWEENMKPAKKQVSYEQPEIPKCDKPLWDRVKDKCK